MSFRLKYFSSHLLLSILIGCLSAYVVFFIWYPDEISKAVGVSGIFLLLLAVDVTIGPILTLFLAKKGKKGLWFDLFIVSVIQLSALVYGIWHIAEARPAWQVINIYRVELVRHHDMDYNGADGSFAFSSWSGPKWALVRPPKDDKERSDWLLKELEGGISPSKQAALFIPAEDNWQVFDKEIISLGRLRNFNEGDEVDATLSEYPEADGYLPVMGGEIDMVLLVSKTRRKFLKIVDLRPW